MPPTRRNPWTTGCAAWANRPLWSTGRTAGSWRGPGAETVRSRSGLFPAARKSSRPATGGLRCATGTSLGSEDATFESEHPVSIEFDLDAGEGVVVASEPAEISLCGERIRVAAGRQRVEARKPGAVVLSLGGVADLPVHEAGIPGRARTASAPGLRVVWTNDAGSGVSCASAGADGVVLGTEDGRVLALDENGKPAWFFQADGPVLSVCPVDLGRAALRDCGRRRPSSLSTRGRRDARWSREFEIYRGTWDRYARNSAVEFVTAADLRGDGRTNILAAVSDRQLHCFDADGDERWSFMIYGIFAPLRVADINRDGRREVIGGPGRITCGGTCYVLDADGREVAGNGLDGWASMMPACDVWVREEDHLIVCGTNRSHVFGLKLEGQSTGDAVEAAGRRGSQRGVRG